jgi:predicted dienelactone hydrolase
MSSPQTMIRVVLLASLIASTIGLGAAQAAAQTVPSFRVGATARQFVPAEPYEWRGDAKHALATTIWYPADPAAEEKPRLLGPPGSPLYDGGRAAADAALAPEPTKFPLIVLSHGTGSTAGSLAWLGTALARAGYVAAAVDHPGNNAIDGYTVEGFTLWWERARDLSAVIDGMFADPTFKTRIDTGRIGAAGFSLGGYTTIAISGGITSLAHYREFCASAEGEASCQAPPEFGDLRAKAKVLAESDAAYRSALATDGHSFRDQRVRAVFAMAPALGPAFLPESLERIDIPVAIVVGAADAIAPVGNNARSDAAHIPHAELTIFHGDVGHYVFTVNCTEAGRANLPGRCVDAPGVDRDAIHAETVQLAEAFFARHLR